MDTTRKAYKSDLTDARWELIAPMIPPKAKRGRKRTIDLREVFNAISYILRTGSQWDYLPHDFPPKDSVFYYYNKWMKDGTLDRINSQMNEGMRILEGREPTPSAGVPLNGIVSAYFGGKIQRTANAQKIVRRKIVFTFFECGS